MGQFTDKIIDGELDREIMLEHGPSLYDVDRIKVSTKSLTMYQPKGRRHPDWGDVDETLTFTKSNLNGQASLKTVVQWNEFQVDICNKGHRHLSNQSRKRHEIFDLDWQYVDQLIEWLNLGSWREVSTRTKPRDSVFKEIDDFLQVVGAANTTLLPAVKSLRGKIKRRIES